MNRKHALVERLRSGFVRRLLGREIWALTDQAVVSATNFLTGVMLARFMGLSEFGVFTLAWMSVAFANSIQNSLIIAPMMSVGPKQEEGDRPFYFGAVVFQELLFVCFYLVLVFAVLSILGNRFRHSELRQLTAPLAV